MQNNGMANYWAQSLNICRQNPAQFLMQMRFGIPAEISNDPEAIVQHLMNTGRMSQNDLQRIQAFKNEVESNFQNVNTR